MLLKFLIICSPGDGGVLLTRLRRLMRDMWDELKICDEFENLARSTVGQLRYIKKAGGPRQRASSHCCFTNLTEQ